MGAEISCGRIQEKLKRFLKIVLGSIDSWGACGSVVVKALSYKLLGSGFETP
jgi:hypothetical protein